MARFDDVLWTPGQPKDPQDKVLPAGEVSERLLYLEKLIAEPKLNDLPLAQLTSYLSQSWNPDPSELFASTDLGKTLTHTIGTITFANGWRVYLGGASTYGYFALYKLGQIVYMEGLIDKNGGNFVGGELLFTLPPGYRPLANLVYGPRMRGGATEAQGKIDFLADGSVTLTAGAPANPVEWITLTGVHFRAKVSA